MRWNNLHSFYTSDEWAKLKTLLLLQRGDVCECGCGEKFRGTWDCIPHHIEELTVDNVNDSSISLNPANLQLVRHRCHNRIHERFNSRYHQRVYLVWGSPCSGKTTFVRDSANGDDLILDVDRVWHSLCLEGYAKPNRLKYDVFAIRNLLLDRVAKRSGNWRNAWIIGMFPHKGERERTQRVLGAEEIYLNSDLDTCLKRCGTDRVRRQRVQDFFTALVE